MGILIRLKQALHAFGQTPGAAEVDQLAEAIMAVITTFPTGTTQEAAQPTSGQEGRVAPTLCWCGSCGSTLVYEGTHPRHSRYLSDVRLANAPGAGLPMDDRGAH